MRSLSELIRESKSEISVPSDIDSSYYMLIRRMALFIINILCIVDQLILLTVIQSTTYPCSIVLFEQSLKEATNLNFMKTNKHILITQKRNCTKKKMKISVTQGVRRVYRMMIKFIQRILSPFKFFLK